ncbi:NuoI/complex I 23 kDa subunit family protein [Planctomycetota bacterium]
MIKYFTNIIKTLWTILVGMSITLKYLLSKPVTLQYPDERWTPPERFRGMVKCEPDKCITCQFCVNICPVSCIKLESVKADIPKTVFNVQLGKEMKKIKNVTNFQIDVSRCLYCGLCTEGCPTKAIKMSHDYETSCRSRQEMIYQWARK